MAKHGKAYLDAKQRFDRAQEYTPAEAIALVKQLGTRQVQRVGRGPRAHRV